MWPTSTNSPAAPVVQDHAAEARPPRRRTLTTPPPVWGNGSSEDDDLAPGAATFVAFELDARQTCQQRGGGEGHDVVVVACLRVPLAICDFFDGLQLDPCLARPLCHRRQQI